MMGTTTGRRLLAALTLALLLGVAAAGPVAAERVEAGGTTWQQQCRSIQDAWLAVRSRYKDASEAEKLNIIAQMRSIWMDWKALNCQDGFGNIWLVADDQWLVIGGPMVLQPTDGVQVSEPAPSPKTAGPVKGVEVVQLAPVVEPVTVVEPIVEPVVELVVEPASLQP